MTEETLDKFELGIIERAIARLVRAMRKSEFVSEGSKHLVKVEALHAKIRSMEDERRHK